MNFRRAMAWLPAILSVWLVALAHASIAAESLKTNAPTGVYISSSNLPESFVVELNTNGAYTVQATGLTTNRQSGLWKWEVARQQFLLTPGTNHGAFPYELRILQVDPRQEDTLRWIPLHDIGATAGAIDYVSFKRAEK